MLEIELYDNNFKFHLQQRRVCGPLSGARQDPSGYEKCVSMCQKSIENLVSLLEEEEAAEARRRPKVINTILYLLYLHISLLFYYTRW